MDARAVHGNEDAVDQVGKGEPEDWRSHNLGPGV